MLYCLNNVYKEEMSHQQLRVLAYTFLNSFKFKSPFIVFNTICICLKGTSLFGKSISLTIIFQKSKLDKRFLSMFLL